MSSNQIIADRDREIERLERERDTLMREVNCWRDLDRDTDMVDAVYGEAGATPEIIGLYYGLKEAIDATDENVPALARKERHE